MLHFVCELRRSRRTLVIAGISGLAIAIALVAAAIALLLDDGSGGAHTFTSEQSLFEPAQTLPDPRGFTSDEVVKNAFEHLYSVDSFTISGEFNAWRQYEASNVPPRDASDPKAIHEIHGRSAKVAGEFIGPDRFELKFDTESQIIEPFSPGVIVSPEQRARIVDGVGFNIPDPIGIPPSSITVTASDGQITSDQPDFEARDTYGSERRKLVLDFISEALGRGHNRWSTDTYLQLANFEELGVRYHGERLISGYRSTVPLAGAGATIFWVDVSTGRLRIIENGVRVDIRGRFDSSPGLESQASIDQYAEIMFAYPNEISSRIPAREI